MEKHGENVAEYEAIEAERDEFSEKVESLESDVSEYSETTEALTAKFAEVVAADIPVMDSDEVAERFSLDELMEKADSLGAFSLATESHEEAEEEADEGEEGEGPTFADKPERGPVPSADDKSAFREQAESDLSDVLGDF
jgi:seryl-tRNA synthetase